jgi:hypothetical protein
MKQKQQYLNDIKGILRYITGDQAKEISEDSQHKILYNLSLEEVENIYNTMSQEDFPSILTSLDNLLEESKRHNPRNGSLLSLGMLDVVQELYTSVSEPRKIPVPSGSLGTEERIAMAGGDATKLGRMLKRSQNYPMTIISVGSATSSARTFSWFGRTTS